MPFLATIFLTLICFIFSNGAYGKMVVPAVIEDSTIVRTDHAGQVIGRAAYNPYGLIRHKEGDLDTPFLYNGKFGILTDSNGLLHMRARYYSPYLMRFLNADPIGFSGGSNWFAYADGNPISLNDPFGLKAAQDDFWGQVMDKFNALAESAAAAVYDPQGVDQTDKK
ncbi:MAG: RHS repeat-associated core domain-containing protein [Akkermansiaceae bacterium]|nr:RHS repeat-associated core domain-containing protein [Akkermansiaceae bacterium]